MSIPFSDGRPAYGSASAAVYAPREPSEKILIPPRRAASPSGPLVCPPSRRVDDVVNRRDPEAVGHARDRGQALLDPRFPRIEPLVEFAECVLLQDARRPTGCIDLESPQPDEIGGAFESL